MPAPFNRREFLIGSMLFALEACGRRRGGSSPPPGHAYIPPPPAYVEGLRYVVCRGDTLSSISRRSGVSISTIINSNQLESNLIYPGAILVLPGTSKIGSDPLRIAADDDFDELGQYRDYRIIRRSSWTNEGMRPNHLLMGSVDRITIHHTGEHGDIARLPDQDVVKRIENYHRNERKWAAIGYHYLIGRNGYVYEGRPAKYQGAHTRSNNRNNLGISMIGDFNIHKPGGVQLATLESLITDMRKKYGVNRRKVFGHRDLSPSVCPGKYLYSWLCKYKAV